MGKGYLNAQEKNICFTLGTFIAYLDTLVGAEGIKEINEPKIEGIWNKLKNPPKKRIKYAKMARTYITKVLEDMLDDIDSSEAIRLLRDVKNREIIVKYKDEAKRHFEDQKNREDLVMYHVEMIKNMADVLFSDTCYKCSRYGKEVENCAVKEVLLTADIEPIEPKPKQGHCPYQWTS